MNPILGGSLPQGTRPSANYPLRDPFAWDGVREDRPIPRQKRPWLGRHTHTCPDGTRVRFTAQHVARAHREHGGVTLYRAHYPASGEPVEPGLVPPRLGDTRHEPPDTTHLDTQHTAPTYPGRAAA